MKRVTLKEIGKQLNLSPGTISKALNDSHEIGEETKKMILAYTQQINYIPNFSAKSLKTGRSNTLAIIVPFISSSFFFDFYEDISLILAETNYKLILLQTFNDEKKEKEALELCVQSKIEGIIISPVKNDSSLPLLKYIMDQICPVIIFDRISHQLETFKIGIQNNRIIYQATAEMIKGGRENIILLLCKDIGGNTSRIKGYKDALFNFSIPFKQENVVEISYSSPKDDIDAELESKIGALLNSATPPNALLSSTDTLSLKVLHILHKLEIRIPEDMNLIGFSNTPFANSLNPSLTTIAQPTRLMAEKSVELLLHMLKKRNKKNYFEFETYFLDCRIEHRKSTSSVSAKNETSKRTI